MELVDILDAGKFAPLCPTLLPDELQELLSPEDRAMYCGQPELSDENEVNDDVDEEIFSPAQTARRNISTSICSRKSTKGSPKPLRSPRETMTSHEEPVQDEDPNVAGINRLAESTRSGGNQRNEVIMVENFDSPIYKVMVKSSHNRLVIEENQVYIALMFVIDMLLREHTDKDDEPKQEQGASSVGNLFKLL